MRLKYFFVALWVCILLMMHLSPTFAQLNTSGSITFGGLQRDYMLYVPATYNPNTSVPLLLNLHGYSSINWQQDFYGDFKPIADTANFIIVTPNGTPDPMGNLFWNVGFFPSPVDDVGFLTALIDTLSASYNINPNRIYSAGMSNGGFMGYSLACNSNRFAGIASVTGSMTLPVFNDCNPQKPILIIDIHGTADTVVPYNGTALFLPIEDVVNFWVQHNNCNTTPQISAVPNTNTTDGATAERYLYTGGTNNTSVEFYKINGGAHTWPGAPITFIGTTCLDFSSSTAIWHFFNQNLPLISAITTPNNIANSTPIFETFPNPADEDLYLTWRTNTQQNNSPQQISLFIHNLQGQKVAQYALNMLPNSNLPNRIDISQLPAGIYTATAANEMYVFTQKIIVR